MIAVYVIFTIGFTAGFVVHAIIRGSAYEDGYKRCQQDRREADIKIRQQVANAEWEKFFASIQ